MVRCASPMWLDRPCDDRACSPVFPVAKSADSPSRQARPARPAAPSGSLLRSQKPKSSLSSLQTAGFCSASSPTALALAAKHHLANDLSFGRRLLFVYQPHTFVYHVPYSNSHSRRQYPRSRRRRRQFSRLSSSTRIGKRLASCSISTSII
jgi:hypothetical protein